MQSNKPRPNQPPSNHISLYSYTPEGQYSKNRYLSFPSGTNTLFNFVKGSKDIYFCDENFNDKNLYSLVNDRYLNSLKLKTIDFCIFHIVLYLV